MLSLTHPPPNAKVLTVAELNTRVRGVLEQAFGELWITGEISNLSRPASGHVYFTLKDVQSQVKAAMWRSNVMRLRWELRDGMEVFARGRVGLFQQTGQYQFYVNELIPKGIGELELAFRQLQEKLLQRGWFAVERKKPLPRFPRRIALVTSPTGAVVRDMIRIITRRWPAVELLVVPVPVQGDGAAALIAHAIEQLNQWAQIDVMIVGRGGGSLEDLWAFNEELVADAIFRSRIPVISAVGHEVDFTIADFVADHRAATPSEAAERVVPDHQEVVSHLEKRLQFLGLQLTKALDQARRRLTHVAQHAAFRDPLRRTRDLSMQVDSWAERLQAAMQRRLRSGHDVLKSQTAQLEGLSPLNVLARGYSLCHKEGDTDLLRSTQQIRTGDRVVTRLWHGSMISRVESVASEPAADARTHADGADL